jgi:hypothetical protein
MVELKKAIDALILKLVRSISPEVLSLMKHNFQQRV